MSSGSSIATISTSASRTGPRHSRPATNRSNNPGTRSRSPSGSRSDSSTHASDREMKVRHQGGRYEGRSKDRPRSPTGIRPDSSHDISDPEEVKRSSERRFNQHRRGDSDIRQRHGRDSRNKRRKSTSADILPDTRRLHHDSGNHNRQRSLSPYSRRLALTQAMNAGS